MQLNRVLVENKSDDFRGYSRTQAVAYVEICDLLQRITSNGTVYRGGNAADYTREERGELYRLFSVLQRLGFTKQQIIDAAEEHLRNFILQAIP